MPQKIRVAFFADMLIKDFDGAARTIYQIVDRIPKDNFEYLFITGAPPKPDFPFAYIKAMALPIPRNSDYRICLPFWSRNKINKALQGFCPDVIHITTPSFLGGFGIHYAKKHSIPVISIYHTHFISYIAYYLKELPFIVEPIRRFVIKKNRSFYNECDCILMPALSIIDELGSYQFDTTKMKLWRRGMNNTLFSPTHRDEQLRIKYKISKPIVLFVSRLVNEKNLTCLLNVYRLAIESGNKYQFVIAGDGVAAPALKAEMTNAIFLGSLSHKELSHWYASSDVFFFPSDTESYGNVVIEAMASGLPVVVADAGGPSDIVSHGQNGMKCDPHDAKQFYNNLELIINDHELATYLRTNGLAYAKSLNWDNLVEEYLGYIRALSNKE